MKHLLIVDYFFPPSSGAGAHRTFGFVKHLPEFGWQPTILTVHGGDTVFQDASLLDEIPDTITVERTASLEPVRSGKRLLRRDPVRPGANTQLVWGIGRGARRIQDLDRWILFPDRQIGWLPFAIARGASIVRRQPIDAIYSTSTVVTSHVIACVLSAFHRKPWVADFQDPWADVRHTSLPSRFHRAAAGRLERLILHRADRVTVTTGPLLEVFTERYPTLPREKLAVIPMGYHPGAFENLRGTRRPKFTITHFGNFYGPRSPGPFLEGVGACVKEDPALANDLEVRLFGTFDPGLRALTEALLDRLNLRGIVSLEGVVPYKAGLQQLMDSDVLLLVTDAGWWGRNLVPSKLYEYLATRKPILALTPEGPAAAIVRDANAGKIVDPTDVHAIRDAILELYWRRRETGPTYHSDGRVVEGFAWKTLTARFASILDEVLSLRSPAMRVANSTGHQDGKPAPSSGVR